MKTIEERAERHLHERMTAIARLVEQNNLSKEVRQSMTFHCYHDYKIGAAEQKAIDIEAIPQLFVRWLMIEGEEPSWLDYANKAMEE